MKKLLFAAFVTFSAFTVSAQTNKGQWLVGGDASFSSTKQDEYKTTSFSVSPNAGYFFIDNFAGGLRLDLTNSTEKFGDFKFKTTSTAVAPFVRYYFLPIGDKAKLFGDASFGFGSMKEKEDDDDEIKTNFTAFSIAAGPAFFLTPNTALEVTLGYTSTKIKDAEDATNGFGINVGFQIHLGGK